MSSNFFCVFRKADSLVGVVATKCTEETSLNGFGNWIAILSIISFVALSGCGGGTAEVEPALPKQITLNARLSSLNSVLPDGRYAIIYRFISTSSGKAKIGMSSDSFRCRLRVEEKLIQKDQTPANAPRLSTSSVTSGTATVQFEVATGRYYLVTASTELPGTAGDFTLSYLSTFKLDGYEYQNYN